MSIQDNPYHIDAQTPRAALVMDPETVKSIQWGLRKKAMHPHSIFVLMIFEYLLAIFFSIPGPSLITRLLSIMLLIQIPWMAMNAFLWLIFIRKNFPAGTQIKEVIAVRNQVFHSIEVKETISGSSQQSS